MPGVYLFAVAVILTMIANSIVEQDLTRDVKLDSESGSMEGSVRPQLRDAGGPSPLQPLLESPRQKH